MAKRIKKTERKKARLGHFDYEDFLNEVGKRIKEVRKEKDSNLQNSLPTILKYLG